MSREKVNAQGARGSDGRDESLPVGFRKLFGDEAAKRSERCVAEVLEQEVEEARGAGAFPSQND